MNWVVMVFGPNHEAKDLRSLLSQEYKNLNIIIIKIAHEKKSDFGLRGKNGKIQSFHRKITDRSIDSSAVASVVKEQKVDGLDPVTKNLNKLTMQTPEGFMEIIDQKDFEKIASTSPIVTSNKGGHHLSKVVEKIFGRICESIELYKNDNI